METFCPLHIDLKGRKTLVVGGGSVARRKVEVLLEYGADLTIVSPELSRCLENRLGVNNIAYIKDHYRPAYLKDKFLVICATDNEAINRQVAFDCTDRGILVNSVSEPDFCTFFFPALLKKGSLTVAISTAGKSPALSRRIKKQLDHFFSPVYETYLNYLGEMRPRIMAEITDAKRRRKIFTLLAGDHFFNFFTESPRSEVDETVEKLIAGKIPDAFQDGLRSGSQAVPEEDGD